MASADHRTPAPSASAELPAVHAPRRHSPPVPPRPGLRSRTPPPLPARRSPSVTPPPFAAVTLDRPRPRDVRTANLYSRAPAAQAAPAAGGDAEPATLPGAKRRSAIGHDVKTAAAKTWPITSQPASAVSAGAGPGRGRRGPGRWTDSDSDELLKPPSSPVSSVGAAAAAAGDSILCSECGRCKCEACRARRPLPQKLVCGRTCLLSAGNAVDCLSCLCCVKAAAYHCAAASDSGSRGADQPCRCAPAGGLCCLRWSALAAVTPLLPCLLCYWPLRGCVAAAEACYQRGKDDGCRCPSVTDSSVGSDTRGSDRDFVGERRPARPPSEPAKHAALRTLTKSDQECKADPPPPPPRPRPRHV